MLVQTTKRRLELSNHMLFGCSQAFAKTRLTNRFCRKNFPLRPKFVAECSVDHSSLMSALRPLRPFHGVNLRPQYGGMTSCSDEREATDCGILAGISEESGPADSCQRS